jgi:hypothetical protein
LYDQEQIHINIYSFRKTYGILIFWFAPFFSLFFFSIKKRSRSDFVDGVTRLLKGEGFMIVDTRHIDDNKRGKGR